MLVLQVCVRETSRALQCGSGEMVQGGAGLQAGGLQGKDLSTPVQGVSYFSLLPQPVARNGESSLHVFFPFSCETEVSYGPFCSLLYSSLAYFLHSV